MTPTINRDPSPLLFTTITQRCIDSNHYWRPITSQVDVRWHTTQMYRMRAMMRSWTTGSSPARRLSACVVPLRSPAVSAGWAVRMVCANWSLCDRGGCCARVGLIRLLPTDLPQLLLSLFSRSLTLSHSSLSLQQPPMPPMSPRLLCDVHGPSSAPHRRVHAPPSLPLMLPASECGRVPGRVVMCVPRVVWCCACPWSCATAPASE